MKTEIEIQIEQALADINYKVKRKNYNHFEFSYFDVVEDIKNMIKKELPFATCYTMEQREFSQYNEFIIGLFWDNFIIPTKIIFEINGRNFYKYVMFGNTENVIIKYNENYGTL